MSDQSQLNQIDLPKFWAPVDSSRAAFVANNAIVMGNVSIDHGVSIWYGAVVRGDVERIEIGDGTNIQDGAIIHCDPGTPTILESYVTIGHRAVIHSAYIETGCLIGIGVIVLDGVTKDVPAYSLMVGVPAKCLRQVGAEEAEGLILHAKKYEKLALVHAGKGHDLGFVE
jgi:carbonic anhydrase/acetyltransferase-like protein (isoleucine patch superfamily)